VTGLLDQLHEELERAMALCGAASIADLDASLIAATDR